MRTLLSVKHLCPSQESREVFEIGPNPLAVTDNLLVCMFVPGGTGDLYQSFIVAKCTEFTDYLNMMQFISLCENAGEMRLLMYELQVVKSV